MWEPQQPTALVEDYTCSFYLILCRISYDGKGTLRVRAMDSNRSLKGSAEAHRNCQWLEEGQSRHAHI